MRRALVILTIVVVAALAACGGGSSGWSKADEQRFLHDRYMQVQLDSRGRACALRVAEGHFGSYREYANESGLAPDTSVYNDEDATEAGKRYINELERECY